jgi:hypothetical protein
MNSAAARRDQLDTADSALTLTGPGQGKHKAVEIDTPIAIPRSGRNVQPVGLTGILYQSDREYSEGFERDGGVGQGPAFEALAPHQR